MTGLAIKFFCFLKQNHTKCRTGCDIFGGFFKVARKLRIGKLQGSFGYFTVCFDPFCFKLC